MAKEIKIALAGNPNSGKTTLFNALTGSNQYVGNWPGVTVEKKDGRLKGHSDVLIEDLPGIYSLSPYTLEEVVSRNYLVTERPDAVLNIVDGTNLERNLYLTTQLLELGIPVVIAINMMDVVKKNGDKINIGELSRELGCRIVEISALKGTGIQAAAEAAIDAAKEARPIPTHPFSGPVEHAVAHIEEAELCGVPPEQQRWYAVKIFERDEKVLAQLNIPKDTLDHMEARRCGGPLCAVRDRRGAARCSVEPVVLIRTFTFSAKVPQMPAAGKAPAIPTLIFGGDKSGSSLRRPD